MVLGNRDEIQQYLDARYIGPPEAVWRIFGHLLHEEYPSVIRLALHLPGMHRVIFNPAEPMDGIISRAEQQMTTLTGFFACCASDEDARRFTYQEFPQHFVWNKTQKKWTPRQRQVAIGRMYFCSPNAGEIFYLRLLLTIVRGPPSYEYLRTFNNILHDTFTSACVARGLLEDDGEWIECLQEAAFMKIGYQLRRLFSTILTQCFPINPNLLWIQFSTSICDDLSHKIRTMFGISNPTESQIEDYGFYLLNQLLQESGKNLKDFPSFPQPREIWNLTVGNRLICEHKQLQYDAQQQDPQVNVECLDEAQFLAYTLISTSLFEQKGTTFFLSGGAGTGKTFVYNTLATKLHSLGHIVVNVLHLDEAPIQHRHCVEAVDRTLQDICDNKKPFGGITVVLGGDFRQILPVIPKGVHEQIVCASLRRSPIWQNIHILALGQNMRLNNSELGNVEFAEFLHQIGTNPQEIIQLPSTIGKCKNLNDLISTIYPRLCVAGTVCPTFLIERTILSAHNDDVNVINSTALNMFPGDTIISLAADKMSRDDEDDRSIMNRYPNEYLNSLDPFGLPPFKLELKVGCLIMLLRNLAPKDGQYNGMRMMVVQCAERIIEAQILTGDKAGNLVFIPRISLTPSSSELPFQMTRRQFPVRLAYTMTMNKSQDQSVKFVGIDLRTPVFSHGQLYVVLSRCTASNRISVLLPQDGSNSTTKIVYPEVLL